MVTRKPVCLCCFFLSLFVVGGQCCGTDSVPIDGADIALKKPPLQLTHCETCTMTIEAKFDNPVVRKETRKADASWSLSRETSLWNETEKKYKPQGAGYDVCLKPGGGQTGTWKPVWTVYKYKRIATVPLTNTGDGKNSYRVYAHFARGSYFKAPGRWQTEYTAGLSVPDKNDPQIVYSASAKDSFSTAVSEPKLYIYAVEGFGGVLPGNDHLNQNVIKKLKEDTKYNDCAYIYKFLYQQADAANLVFESIENQIYMDFDCGCNKLALVGYSNGGYEVLKIANTVGKQGGFSPTFTSVSTHFGKIYPARTINIDLLFTIDPVKQGVPPTGNYGFKKPANAKTAVNFYQRVDGFHGAGSLQGVCIYGDNVDGADNTQYSIST